MDKNQEANARRVFEIRSRMGGREGVRHFRTDGYINLLNKYGGKRDSSSAYNFMPEPTVPDIMLTSYYEGNGLFAKIIDTPADEALKRGFDLKLKDDAIQTFIEDKMDELEWEEKAATAIKWARLYGGSIIVMLINDGRGLDEPVNWSDVRGIDELRVYERPLVMPDYTGIYGYNGLYANSPGLGKPEYYYVSSIYGSFVVHESRCLLFKNGTLPENTSNSDYRFWGMPELVRIKKDLQETITAHGNGYRLLERSVQAVYKMKGLAALLTTDQGENQALKRLELIDAARGILNSIAIDNEGEDYDFKSITFTGVKDIIDSACNMLSALTNIPQTILFGRSPAGETATGESDMENWYNYIERIQKVMLKKNLRTLLDVIFLSGLYTGDLTEKPAFKLEFTPLWSLSEKEQADVDKTKADTEYVKAQTAQIYCDMQAIDPSEVRKGLASSEEFNVEDLVEEEDDQWGLEDPTAPAGGEEAIQQNMDCTSAATLVIKDGKILCATRKGDGSGLICGPGGHIEDGETPEAAARREAMEEFGIMLGDLVYLGKLDGLPEEFGVPAIFICTEYGGTPVCDEKEMTGPEFLTVSEINEAPCFDPFDKSIDLLFETVIGNIAPELSGRF